MASRRNARYSRLPSDEVEGFDGYEGGSSTDTFKGGRYDPRFDFSPRALDKVPWKSIALAFFLLSLGSLLLFVCFFILTGHMPGDSSQAYGFLALGILTFLPGFYETRVAYYSWRGAPGYRFSAIPDY